MSKFYRREGGVIVGGPYNCDQAFPVEQLADDHPDVVAFNDQVTQIRAAKVASRVSIEGRLSALETEAEARR